MIRSDQVNNLIKTDYNLISPEEIQQEIVNRYLMLKEGTTKDQYRNILGRFFEWLKASDNDSIRPHIVALYKIHIQASSKPATVNKYLTVLKDFFSWCHELGYLPYDASKGVKRVRVPKQDKARALSSQEVSAILNATKDDHELVMLNCMFYLGLRASEVAGLMVSSFDLERNIVEIMGKGSKIRTLGVSSELRAVIVKHIKKYAMSDFEFIVTTKNTTKGKPVSIQHINRVIKRIAKAAGVDPEGIKSHSCRATAINFLLDNDVTLRDAANFAGHSNINTTRGYDRRCQERVIQTCNIINFKEDN